MNDDIETPEGWERSGPCFTRVYDGKLAVIQPDTPQWSPNVFDGGAFVFHGNKETLPEAVAWANEQLGLPKPVEVVEREFADGSVLVCDANQSRSARVSPRGDGWYCDSKNWLFWPTKERALEAARAYVRGDA